MRDLVEDVARCDALCRSTELSYSRVRMRWLLGYILGNAKKCPQRRLPTPKSTMLGYDRYNVNVARRVLY